ncbi:MAG: thioether cross-link-forming SCIFF peptide maturase [Syntrophomonadaceae bacterium]|nr:thioether cross-link-forming SCIFF peptide maturase [Syntrophomonadaceae bacterium]
MNREGFDFAATTHVFTVNGATLLLDVNSGAVHLLDEVMAALVQALEACGGCLEEAIRRCCLKWDCGMVMEAAGEIARAVEAGVLFTPGEVPHVDMAPFPIKALCLNVAHVCNMRCVYCFAGQGDFGQPQGLMSLEVGKAALDFLLEAGSGPGNLEVDFFGGEPTLNSRVVRELVGYGRERAASQQRNIHFTLTTNAMTLDQELTEFLVKQDVALVLSVDGRPHIHDRHRVLAGGGGTYTAVMRNVRRVVDRGARYVVRGTFTRDNLDFASDIEHLADCGFSHISMEPVVGTNQGWAIREQDIPIVAAEYERLAVKMHEWQRQGRGIDFFHFNLHASQGPCVAKRVTGCGAGNEYLAVTPAGDIYPCHQFVGCREFLMGNVFDRAVDENVRATFARLQVANKPECRSCWCRYFCGGGCAAHAYFAGGTLEQPAPIACQLQRKRVECALWLLAMENLPTVAT